MPADLDHSNENSAENNEAGERASQDAGVSFPYSLLQPFLDSLTSGIVVIDPDGSIVAANLAWREERSTPESRLKGLRIGDDYLRALDGLDGSFLLAGETPAEGVRSVLEGKRENFECDIPGPGSDALPFIRINAAPLAIGKDRFAILTHTPQLPAAADSNEKEHLAFALGERVKELNAFYQVADLLRGNPEPTEPLFDSIIESLRHAMQFPAITSVRIVSGPYERSHEKFRATPWTIEARLDDRTAGPGALLVAYLKDPGTKNGNVFLEEERRMVNSIAEVLRTYFSRQASARRLREDQERLQKQYEALRFLTQSEIWHAPDDHSALKEITKTVARALEIERFSIWTLVDDNSAIVALDLYRSSHDLHETGTRLEARDFPAYFAAIETSEVLSCPVAVSDPRTSEFAESYLKPNGIASMLDAPIIENGVVRGVVCAEHVGAPREWTLADISFVVSVANLIALLDSQRSRVRSESRMRTILESEPECVKVVTREGMLAEMNPAGLRMIEAESLDEVRGKSVITLIHPADREAYLERHDRSFEGESGTLQFRITGLRGTTRWVESNSTPLKDPDGQIRSVLSVTRDITSRRKAENALLRVAQAVSKPVSDDFYFELALMMSQALDAKGGAIAILDPERPRHLKTIAFAMDGARYEDVCYGVEGTPCEDVVHGFPKVFENGIQTLFPSDKMLADFGLEAYAGVPLSDAHGKVIGLIAALYGKPIDNADLVLSSLQIIAERVSLEMERSARRKELRSAESLTKLILDSVGEGIQRLDSSGNILFENPEAARLLGWKPQSIIGKHAHLTIHHHRPDGSEYPVDECPIFKTLHDGKPRSGNDEYFVRQDGSFFPISYTVSGIFTDAGEITGAVISFRDITEQKEAEKKLRESEIRFRRIFDEAATGIAITTLEGRFVDGNRAYCEMLGYTPEELKQLKFIDITHPEDREENIGLIEDLIEGKREALRYEKRYLHKNGKPVWVRISVSLHHNVGGEAIGLVGITEDITIQKQAEDALRKSEAALRFASKLGRLGAWEVKLPEMEVNWTEETNWIFELPVGEFPSVEDAILRYAPEHQLRIRTVFEACILQGIPFDEEDMRIISFKGTERIVRVLGEAVRDPTGKIIGARGAIQDTTDYYRAKEAVHESEQRFRLLSKATNDAVWDWNLQTDELWWSDGFESLFGFSRSEQEPDSTSWTNRIHPDDRDWVITEVDEAIKGNGDSWSGEYRFARKDGTYAFVLDRGYLIRDPEGVAVRMVGGMTDLTDRRNLEAQLRQSQKMEAIGQLAGGVAHDFNNILTVINGYSDLLLRQTSESDRAHKALTGIMDAGRRAEGLTRQLLAFSRRQVLAPRILQINGIISDTTKMMGRLIGENIELELRLSSDLRLVKVDPGQFEQILVNLAVNARDAMPNGGKLLIETANVQLDEHYCNPIPGLEPGNYISVSMSDTGVGIPDDIKQHVFEPFFTTKEVGKGTGLGLATVFGIVKQSGGHVTLYSEVGVGTTFRVYLPIVSESEIHETSESPFSRDVPVGNEVVLLVEDEDAVREITRQTLEDCGYKVFEAQNGEAALELIKTLDLSVDILVSDIIMPKIGGRELAKQVVEQMPNCKVLLISGYTEDAVLMHGIMNEEFAFLQKPFTPSVLAKKVRECLDSGVSG
ncbi:MAG: PAS domain S-box protein [Acidobacteria bacterium]|nr:PAS domain S-box protein [Acidobacteriota bacterium]